MQIVAFGGQQVREGDGVHPPADHGYCCLVTAHESILRHERAFVRPNSRPRRISRERYRRERPTKPAHLTVFVYGTLKRSFENHDLFCRDALYAGEAVVRGRLYDLPDGYPGLVVPGESILATGTGDSWADAATQDRLNGTTTTIPEIQAGEWDEVQGEVLAFGDPGSRLPPLDRLEGFDPNAPSLYQRVLLPVRTSGSSITAWTYVVGAPSGVYLPGGRWQR
ncbi:MAG: gamma-glutamylcyclotransferase family protein [Rubrobacteraceae bacterium]